MKSTVYEVEEVQLLKVQIIFQRYFTIIVSFDIMYNHIQFLPSFHQDQMTKRFPFSDRASLRVSVRWIDVAYSSLVGFPIQ